MKETIKIKKTGEKNEMLNVVINEMVSIDNSDMIKEKLIPHLKKCTSVQLELRNINALDLSGLQLIIAVKIFCKTNNIEFKTDTSFSDDLSQLIKNCGFETVLMN